MGILADAAARALAAQRRGPPCSVKSLRDGLSEQDRAELDTAIDQTPTLQMTKYADELAKLGVSIGVTALTRHRNRRCLCPR